MNKITTTGINPFNPSLKMSSVEIAELMEKRHDHVMRDIQVLIEEEAISLPNFGESTYKNDRGKEYPMYLLDFDATMLLITGYDSKRRMMVIKRWRQLETGEALPGISDAALEVLVRKAVAVAMPLVLAQQAPGYFIETATINDYLAWLPYELKRDSFTTKSALYDSYGLYCLAKETVQLPSSHFFTRLYRCLPSLKSARIQVAGKRTSVVLGISILPGVEQ